ncbi:hypothetical protein CMK14_23585 [Candidatus Poribacteria bacterium]|nr:hypothetical protein [Candidatus Poribacteria bacterium]
MVRYWNKRLRNFDLNSLEFDPEEHDGKLAEFARNVGEFLSNNPQRSAGRIQKGDDYLIHICRLLMVQVNLLHLRWP